MRFGGARPQHIESDITTKRNLVSKIGEVPLLVARSLRTRQLRVVPTSLHGISERACVQYPFRLHKTSELQGTTSPVSGFHQVHTPLRQGVATPIGMSRFAISMPGYTVSSHAGGYT